jgi:hypothetical protein
MELMSGIFTSFQRRPDNMTDAEPALVGIHSLLEYQNCHSPWMRLPMNTLPFLFSDPHEGIPLLYQMVDAS